jgi:membrane-associated phospholipid phosphatase
MALTLMATGEHYFFDVLIGWIYAGGVMAAWAWWERRRARLKVRLRSLPPGYRAGLERLADAGSLAEGGRPRTDPATRGLD